MKKRLERTGVMLAYPLDDKFRQRLNAGTLKSNFYAQPKLNGERCRAEYDSSTGTYQLFSSYGNRFLGFQHIEEKLNQIGKGITWDGELYFHGWPRETIHSIASRKTNPHPLADKLQFHIFDSIENKPQWERLLRMYSILHRESPIHLVPTDAISSEEEMVTLLDRYLAYEYEGIILRDPQEYYTPKRSKALIKFKPNKTDRYRIIGVEEEIDIYGDPKDSLGAVTVIDNSGNVFNVGSGSALTKEGRKHFWEKRDSIIGMNAIVKHSIILTTNNIPTCTSLISIE